MKKAYLVKPNSVSKARYTGVLQCFKTQFRDYFTYYHKADTAYSPRELLEADVVLVDLGDDTFNLELNKMPREVIKDMLIAMFLKKPIYGVYKRKTDSSYALGSYGFYRLNFCGDAYQNNRINFLAKDPQIGVPYTMEGFNMLGVRLSRLSKQKFGEEDIQSIVKIVSDEKQRCNLREKLKTRKEEQGSVISVDKNLSRIKKLESENHLLKQELDQLRNALYIRRKEHLALITQVDTEKRLRQQQKLVRFAEAYGASCKTVAKSMVEPFSTTKNYQTYNPLTGHYDMEEPCYREMAATQDADYIRQLITKYKLDKLCQN